MEKSRNVAVNRELEVFEHSNVGRLSNKFDPIIDFFFRITKYVFILKFGCNQNNLYVDVT